MAVLESCPKHNMVAYLEKTEGNVEFHEVIDFLARSSIHLALTILKIVIEDKRGSDEEKRNEGTDKDKDSTVSLDEGTDDRTEARNLKSKTFEEIQALYEKVKRFDESFTIVGSTKDEKRIKEMNEGVKDTDTEEIKEEKTQHIQWKLQSIQLSDGGDLKDMMESALKKLIKVILDNHIDWKMSFGDLNELVGFQLTLLHGEESYPKNTKIPFLVKTTQLVFFASNYCCSNVGSVDKFVRDPNLISYDETPDSPSQTQTSSLNQRHCFHCKDLLKEHEHCKRCTCMRCGSGLSKGFCFICDSSNKNSSQRSRPKCPTCGDPVKGLYCQQCALIRKKLEEVFQDFQDTSESSNENTNVISVPQEPFVFNQDPGKNSSQNPPHIDHCCYGCGDSSDDIFCQRCTCESCGKGAHIGYNCPPKVPIIYNPEPCNNQTINELPQTLPSVHPTCYSGDENSFTNDSNFVDDSPSPPQNSSGSTTTRSDYSLPDYEAFYLDDDHIEEKSSGSTTTHADFSQYDSFIFDLSIDSFPPADRSDFYHEEFANELAHIISPSEYDFFYFKSEPDPGELTSIVDSGIRENVLSTTNVNLPFEDDQSPLLAYVVWIFLPFLTYPVTLPYLLSCGNEDTIFDPDISVYHSFMPGTGYSLEDKNRAKPDKTEHENGKKHEKSKRQSQTRVTTRVVPRGLPAVTGATTGPLVNGAQRRQSTVANDGQWRRTTVDHRRTTGQRWLTASQRSGQMVATASTWHALSANWVLVAYVAATSAADVAEGILPSCVSNSRRKG
ncbi:hypothetical protein Tco_0487706 [Tanacetum coccineum]